MTGQRANCKRSDDVLDLVIRGGEVIDGTRAPRFRADVGVVGDRIAAIGDLRDAAANTVINASGKIVAPGFIDVHNHSDGWLIKEPVFAAKLKQGFTTELLTSDGIGYAPVDEVTAPQWLFYLRCLNGLRMDEYRGWESLAEYQQTLDHNTASNTLVQVPYANVRTLLCGFGRAAVDDLQRRLIQAEIRRGMEDGATGLSTGLDYITQCFSTTDEIVDAARVLAEFDGVYVTHIRYKLGMLAGVQEAIEIGRRAGCAVHISHLKAHAPADIETVLQAIDAATDVDITFETYPYQPGSTMLNYLLPYEVWEDGPLAVLGKLMDPAIKLRFRRGLDSYRLPLDKIHIAWVASAENKHHQGRFLSEYAEAVDLPIEDALLRLLIEERLAVLLVFHEGDEALMRPFLAHPKGMVGSDGIYFPDGVVHPRVTSTAPRVLGRAVRDWKLFPLEDAVYKLSGFAAKRFGAVNRGVIAPNHFADVVVFDPKTVHDHGTFSEPHQDPAGIEHVLVNGSPVIAQGKVVLSRTDALPGRALIYRRE
ncbi:MAG TPA: D-aminoacylase [Planctomycetaceae bacterium]|nr:D-aminoacylase [Planctomycetaceae bacterium]